MDLALVTCGEDWLMVRVSTQAGFAFVKGLSLCQVANYKLDSVIYQFVIATSCSALRPTLLCVGERP